MVLQYLLFAGYSYCPHGGWGDLQNSYATFEEALVAASHIVCDWYHIVDTKTGKIVESACY